MHARIGYAASSPHERMRYAGSPARKDPDAASLIRATLASSFSSLDFIQDLRVSQVSMPPMVHEI
jgi:hypothetical protein